MTTLAANDLDPNQLDLLSLVADNDTPLGRARWGEIDPRWYSAQWAPACGPNGFLDKTDVWVAIDGTHSRGNAGKSVRLRRLRT